MSFDEEHLSEHHECQAAVAELEQRLSKLAGLVAAAREIRDLGTWSATEDGDLVLTCSDGSTEISYLATRASVVARALTAIAEVGRG